MSVTNEFLNVGDVIELDKSYYIRFVSPINPLTVTIRQEYSDDDSVSHDVRVSGIKQDYLDGVILNENQAIILGDKGQKLLRRNFAVVSKTQIGIPREDIEYHGLSGLDHVQSGQFVTAQQVGVGLNLGVIDFKEPIHIQFYQGEGFDHSFNYTKVIGRCDVNRTYTFGRFIPK
jgi:hypothetical protein